MYCEARGLHLEHNIKIAPHICIHLGHFNQVPIEKSPELSASVYSISRY